jgi:probable rRNA maturation factor
VTTLQLDWSNEQDEIELPEQLDHILNQLLFIAGQSEHMSSGEVTLTFVSDTDIQTLNAQYRGIDKPTDVLSFSMLEAHEEEMSIQYDEAPEPSIGDIVIAVPTALRQSIDYGHSLQREIGFLFVHGFLHLLGYDHTDEASEQMMISKQEHILQQAGLVR